MTKFRKALPFILCLIPFAAMAFAQTTSITLPTNDDTSAFEVQKVNGTTVLKATGDGDVAVSGTMSAQDIEVSGDAAVSGDITTDGAITAQTLSTSGNAAIGGSVSATSFHGDGSALSNVQTKIASIEGNQRMLLSSDFQIVRTVEITVPEAGYIHVTATGTAEWESKETDFLLSSILPTSSNPETSFQAESELFRNICLMSDFACADSSDQYSVFSTSRTFRAYGAGTYSYSFWANDAGDFYPTSRTVIQDTNMTAMYFPSGSIVISNEYYKPAFSEEPQAIEPRGSGISGN